MKKSTPSDELKNTFKAKKRINTSINGQRPKAGSAKNPHHAIVFWPRLPLLVDPMRIKSEAELSRNSTDIIAQIEATFDTQQPIKVYELIYDYSISARAQRRQQASSLPEQTSMKRGEGQWCDCKRGNCLNPRKNIILADLIRCQPKVTLFTSSY